MLGMSYLDIGHWTLGIQARGIWGKHLAIPYCLIPNPTYLKNRTL
jgi:hypothetical protein